MESGEAHGDFYADNFYFNNGDSVRTLISKTAKGNTVDFSDLDYIDLGGIVLDGKTGNINFTGAGSITWGNNAPVKYQFAASATGPWHDTMAANDKYRRDSLDGGTTWGTAYQFRGTDGRDGRPGTDGDPKRYLESIKITEINEDSVKSAKIEGAEIWGANIYGGAFHDLSGKNTFTIGTTTTASGDTFGDLSFSNDGDVLFSIYDAVSHVTMRLCGINFANARIGGNEITLSDNVIVHATFA